MAKKRHVRPANISQSSSQKSLKKSKIALHIGLTAISCACMVFATHSLARDITMLLPDGSTQTVTLDSYKNGQRFNTVLLDELKNADLLPKDAILKDEVLYYKGDGSDYKIEKIIGLKGIKNFKYFDVDRDGTFYLVGEPLAEGSESISTQLTDMQTIINTGNTLQLGHDALTRNEGMLQTIVLKPQAELKVTNGVFGARVTEAGTVTISETGVFEVMGSSSQTSFVNSGLLNFQSNETQIGASLRNVAGNSIANLNNLTVLNGGTVSNESGATMRVNQLLVHPDGTFENAADGVAEVSMVLSGGRFANFGKLNVTEGMALMNNSATILSGEININYLELGEVGQADDAPVVTPDTGGDSEPVSISGWLNLYEPVAAPMMPAVPAAPAVPDLTPEDEVQPPLLEIMTTVQVRQADLHTGDVFIRTGGLLSADVMEADIGAHIRVEKGGMFAAPIDKEALSVTLQKYAALPISEKAVAVLTRDLKFSSTGKLTLGSASDTSGNINLGPESLVIYTGEALNGSNGTQLRVEPGAMLAMDAEKLWGNNYIAVEFDDRSLSEATLLTVVNEHGQEVQVARNEKGVYVLVGTTDITDKDSQFRLANNINSILDGRQDPLSPMGDVAFLTQAVGHKDGVKATQQLEGLSAESGALAETVRLSTRSHDAVLNRGLSMSATGPWVEVIGSKFESDGFKSAGGEAGYEATAYGLVFGADGRNGQLGWGGALHYMQSDIEATTSVTETQLDAFGASLYGSYYTNWGINFTAGLTFTSGDAEVTQKNILPVTAKTDTQALTMGLRMTVPMKVSKKWAFAPYLGVDAVKVKEKAYTVSIDGKRAFTYQDIEEDMVRLPIGVIAETTGKKSMAFVDISVTPQFGVDGTRNIRGVNTDTDDVSEISFADKWVGNVKVGGAMSLGKRATISASYAASVGDVRKLSHEAALKATYKF